MLTIDLLRVRCAHGQLYPQYIDPHDPHYLQMAAELVDLFKRHRGQRRSVLDNSLKELLAQDTNLAVRRGLIKLLQDRCEFATTTTHPPEHIRQLVFTKAAQCRQQGHFDRTAILQEAASELGLSPEVLERDFYGDLKEKQELVDFKALSPQRLLQRYNVALVQGILLKATQVEITVQGQSPRRYRQLFRAIKFHRLLHQIQGSAQEGYQITLDGPLSLFSACQKYGFQMAQFLPALLLCSQWELKAQVLWGPQKNIQQLALSYQEGLVSHYPDHGMWFPPEWHAFVTRFQKLDSPWRISVDSDLVELAQQVIMVPDYIFTHTQTGRQVYLEIFGYWRRGAIEKRLALLAQYQAADILLAVSRKLRISRQAQEIWPRNVYLFKEVLIPREVLACLDKLSTEQEVS